MDLRWAVERQADQKTVFCEKCGELVIDGNAVGLQKEGDTDRSWRERADGFDGGSKKGKSRKGRFAALKSDG